MRFLKGHKYLLLSVHYTYYRYKFEYYFNGIYISDGTQIECFYNDNDVYIERGIYMKNIHSNRYKFIQGDDAESLMVEYCPIKSDDIYFYDNKEYSLVQEFNFPYIVDWVFNKNPLLKLLKNNNDEFIIVDEDFFINNFKKLTN